jgi:superfamily I DNA and RNA helicase
VLSGPLKTGQPVEIVRPDRNSPLSVAALEGFPTIEAFEAANIGAEVDWAVGKIHSFISGGLQPEEVLVIALDDRNARRYLAEIAETLANEGVSSNNIIADPYNEPPMLISACISRTSWHSPPGSRGF